MDSADQRAGRAARLGPGLVRRLWDARDRLRATSRSGDRAGRSRRACPRPARVGRRSAVVRLVRSAIRGSNPSRAWLAASSRRDRRRGRRGAPHGARASVASRSPPSKAGANSDRRPRSAGGRRGVCARLSLGCNGSQQVRQMRRCGRSRRSCSALRSTHLAATWRRISLTRRCGTRCSPGTRIGLRSAVPASHDRFLLASGHGAALAREAGSVAGDYIVALDVVAAEREGNSEARIRSASEVEREWIQPTSTAVEHRFDAGSGRVRAARVERYDAIVLNETPVQVDAAAASALLGTPGSPASTTRRRRSSCDACGLPQSTSTCLRSPVKPRQPPGPSTRSISKRICLSS